MTHNKNTSPFRYHPEDQLKIFRSSTNKFRLTEDERIILEGIHRSIVVTPMLLLDQLSAPGISTGIQNLQLNLHHLFNRGFLNKLSLEDPDGCTPPQTIYALSKAYLRSLEETPEKLDLLLCKRLLATQQYLGAAGHYRSASAVTMNARITEPDTRPGFFSDHTFRCDALIRDPDGQTTFVLAIRKEKNWLEKLKEQLSTMERTIFSPCPLNVPTKDSRIILICEDEDHQTELEQALIRDQTCRYEFPVFVDNDIQTFSRMSSGPALIPELKKSLAQQVSGRMLNCIETALKM